MGKSSKHKVYVESHFLDSGAFTQLTKAIRYAKENNCSRWDYFDTPSFWEYLNGYANFVKKYKIAIDLYANLDVIPDPELTWRNQQYLEKKHGLKPVPIVHYGTNLKWLKMYIQKGYKLIGLGGLVGNTVKQECREWIDSCFNFVCDNPKRLPEVKLHGFGITGWKYMWRYPWWSVDSAAWDKAASYGGIYVPKKKGTDWAFDKPPYVIKVSAESPERHKRGNHFLTLGPAEQQHLQDWIDFLGLPMGKWEANEDSEKDIVIEQGVVTFHVYRRIANLHYFKMMSDALPKYPWPFNPSSRKGLW